MAIIVNHQKTEGFDLPEFYDNGVIASVVYDNETVQIHRDGQALAFYDKAGEFSEVIVLRTPQDFREAFPDGNIPEDLLEWRLNGWFDLYDIHGEHLDVVGFELQDMIETAQSFLSVSRNQEAVSPN